VSLLGLPDTWRLAVFNGTGITISNVPTGLPRVSGKRVRYDSNGVLSYEATETTFLSFAQTTVAANSYVVGSTLCNVLSTWLGLDGLLSCFASGNASGSVYLYLENSPDGGTTWPTPASANGAGGGLLIGVIGYGSTTTVSTASTTQRLAVTFP
jgi:hypothetical protein